MSTTKITYLQKTRSGMIFREDFENDDFLEDSGWILLEGEPEISTDQAKAGLSSLKMSGALDEGGFPPILTRNIPYYQLGYNDTPNCSVWFYDDISQTALPGPFIKIQASDGQFCQIGVRNSVSTTNYVGGCGSEDSFTDLGPARSTGWHLFEFRYTYAYMFAGWGLYVDGTFITRLGASGTVSTVYLQGDVYGNATDSFGYFDEVQLTWDGKADIYRMAEPWAGSLWEANGNYINDLTLRFWPDGNYSLEIAPGAANLVVPTDFYVTLSQAGSNPILQPLNRTLLSQFCNGDSYQIFEIDFDRKATAFDDIEQTILTQGASIGGQTETLTTGLSNQVSLSFADVEGRLTFAQVQNFYEYARTGGPFSVCLESDEAGFAFVVGDTLAGFSYFTVATPFGGQVVSSFFKPGNNYVVENADHTQRQIFKITSITDGFPIAGQSQIYMDSNLLFDLQQGAVLRSLFFYPALRLADPSQGHLELTDARWLRYGWSDTFMEYVSP